MSRNCEVFNIYFTSCQNGHVQVQAVWHVISVQTMTYIIKTYEYDEQEIGVLVTYVNFM